MTAMKVGQKVWFIQYIFGWPPGTEGTVGHILPATRVYPWVAYVVDIPGPDSSGPDGRYASVYVRSDQLEPIDEDGAE